MAAGGRKRATMRQVAERAGVSSATVSRILNGKDQRISDATRERVWQAVRELGYRPNTLARALKLQKTQTIGVVIPNIQKSFYADVVAGIEAEAADAGYRIMLCNANDRPELEREYIEMLQAAQVDGFLVSTSGGNEALYGKMARMGIPLVLFDRELPGVPADQVCVDNYRGAYEAVAYLVRQGHRRVALVSHELKDISTRIQRFQGYVDALRAAGVRGQDHHVWYVPEDARVQEGVLAELMGAGPMPTAIFATNGMLGLHVMRMLRQRGLRVPEDVSVVAFDSPEWAPFVNPPLTAVSQPAQELGSLAARLLLQKLEGGDAGGKPERRVLEARLVVRGSTKRAQLGPAS